MRRFSFSRIALTARIADANVSPLFADAIRGDISSMPELGKKYTCYSCHTKFYDLGKPEPLCPKCGADQRDAEETPLIPSHRGRRIVEEPAEEPEFPDAEPAADSEEDEDIVPAADREEEADEEEEEEY
jgi:hypothetical protein